MADSVIAFDNVWKKFQRGERHTSLRDLIPSIGRSLVRRQPSDDLVQQEFWAVRDVSFEVRRGEALGIIGPNGAGKSTTLKLLTKILRPTRGHCSIKGRTGALIEVAAGFHPDLTGRENVYLQGAIMGMPRADITRKLDAIVDFSGLHEFIDTQVKRYSSGMNARLGFSIAANLEPDALVIDEVLAVGDMAFQQRCIDRMQDFKRDGVAIVFVSHNLQAVSALCTRALFLASRVEAVGEPDAVIQTYVSSADGALESTKNDRIRILVSRLFDDQDRPVDTMVAPGANLTLRATFMPAVPATDVTFGLVVYRSTDNLLVYDGHFSGASVGMPAIVPGQPFAIEFRFRANLTRGHYRAVTRIYDNSLQSYLAGVCPPATFAINELQTSAGVANLEGRLSLREIDGDFEQHLADQVK